MHVPWMGIFFWIGLFTWFAVIAWTRFLRERERQQTLRSFAERGAPLNPEAMEKLFPKPVHWSPPPHHSMSAESVSRGLVTAGIIALFAGFGLLMGAQIIGRIEEEALYGMSTGGVIIGSVGLGLIVTSIVTRRWAGRQEPESRSPDDAIR